MVVCMINDVIDAILRIRLETVVNAKDRAIIVGIVCVFISAICLAVFSFILKSSVFLPRGCVFSLSVYTYSL